MSAAASPMSFDDLELELRKLPGVRAAGFTERDDVLLVQIQVMGDDPPAGLPLQATRLAYRHSEKPVAVEIVRWRDLAVPETAPETIGGPTPFSETPFSETPFSETPFGEIPVVEADRPAVTQLSAPVELEDERGERVRLLAVLTFPDTDELEVHLTHGGRRIIGRAAASKGALGVVEATIDGLRSFAPGIDFSPQWAHQLEDVETRDAHLIACEMVAPDGSRRLGVASGASQIEAAARATLHALNRSIAPALVAD